MASPPRQILDEPAGVVSDEFGPQDELTESLRVLALSIKATDQPLRMIVLKSLTDEQLKKLDGGLHQWLADMIEEFRARGL